MHLVIMLSLVLQVPIDECFTFGVLYYEVRVNSSKSQIIAAVVYNEIIYLSLESHQFTEITINITAVYRGGLHSHPAVQNVDVQLTQSKLRQCIYS